VHPQLHHAQLRKKRDEHKKEPVWRSSTLRWRPSQICRTYHHKTYHHHPNHSIWIGESSNLRSRSFKPLLKLAGLPDICFHDLRHTCATLLLSQGTHPKLVQELLGHATIAMTLDTYSHFLPSMGDQTVKSMEAALS
jgi:integrase